MSGPPWLDESTGRRPARGSNSATAAQEGPLHVTLQPGRLQIIVWLVVGSLICLNFLVIVTGQLKLLPWTITRFFDGTNSLMLGAKTTVALLSALLMFGCAALARRRGDREARAWRLLAWVTCFVFADETTSLHATVAQVLQDRYHFHGAARYTWAVIYLPAVIAVAVVLVRDVRRMAPGVRRRWVPGAVGWAVGAIGLEPFLARLAEELGGDSLSFRIAAAVADSCELVGLVLVLCAALVAADRLVEGVTFVQGRERR